MVEGIVELETQRLGRIGRRTAGGSVRASPGTDLSLHHALQDENLVVGQRLWLLIAGERLQCLPAPTWCIFIHGSQVTSIVPRTEKDPSYRSITLSVDHRFLRTLANR